MRRAFEGTGIYRGEVIVRNKSKESVGEQCFPADFLRRQSERLCREGPHRPVGAQGPGVHGPKRNGDRW